MDQRLLDWTSGLKMFFNSSPRRTLEFRPPSSQRKPSVPAPAPVERPAERNERAEPSPARDAKRFPARSGFYTAVDEFKGLENLDRIELDDEEGDEGTAA